LGVQAYVLGGGAFGEARHRHDLAAEGDDEAGAGGEADVANGQREAGGGAA